MLVRTAGVLLLALIAAPGVQGDDALKNRPVSKVITLLKDMITQLGKEAEEDQDVYDTMNCWCETNDREKTKAISENTERISALQAGIEQHTAQSAQLNTEVKNLNTEVAKNQAALDKAGALRAKQLKEFNEEEKDMLQSISSLKSAVVVMDKQALLQDATKAISLAVMLKDQLHTHEALLGEVLSASQKRMIQAFAKAPEEFLQTGAPSDSILGVLKQMKETFEGNLAASQKEEMENQKAFEDLKAAKTEEIVAGQSQVDTKTQELAVADQKKAQGTEDLEDTQKTLAADQTFLAGLKQTCGTLDAEYEERTKSRQAEIQATSKALEFLSSDEAHDLFSRSTGFLQLSRRSTRESSIRARVLAKIQAVTAQDPRLQALAVRVRMDTFGKVKESIQGMLENLLKEKEDDIKHKDFCVDEFNKNERSVEGKEREKSEKLAKIDDLQMTIDETNKAIETMKASIAEMHVQMKRAGEDREKENKDFQLTIADQRATQKLLGAALGVLKDFYEKAALVQDASKKATASQDPMPPVTFKPRAKSAASGGVMGMIQMVIDDSKAMEAEAVQGEEDAQKGYEKFVKDTNASIEQTSEALVNKEGEKGAAEQELVQMQAERDEILGELETLYQENHDLHGSCDFLLKNFEVRSTARDEEVEALKQSIAMFSGASFNALLQGRRA